MHVAWSAIFSPPEGGAAPSIEEIRERVTRRLGWVPRCRQRLLPAPLGLSEPRWVDDEAFDVAAHVVALTEPDDPVGPERFAAAARRAALHPAGSRPAAVAARLRPAAGRRAPRRRRARAPRDGRRRRRPADRAADDRHRRPRRPGRRSRRRAVGGRGAADDAAARARPARPRRRADLPRGARRPRMPPRIRAPPPATRCATPAGSSPRSPRTCCRTRRESGLNRPLGPRRTLVQHRVALERGARGQPRRAGHAQRRRPRRDRRRPARAGAGARPHAAAAEGDGAGQHAPRA